MAFGLPPAYDTDLSLDNLTPHQFLAIAVGIAQKLEWEVRQTSEAGLVAFSSSKVFKAKAKITIRIEDDEAHIRSECTGTEMMDLGRNRRIIDKFRNLFYDEKYTFSPEEAALKYEELKSEAGAGFEAGPNAGPAGTDSDAGASAVSSGGAGAPAASRSKGSFLSLFIPKKGFWVTPLLIDINVVVFIVMVLSGVSAFSPDSRTLVLWGANFRPSTLNGEWWRLFTNIFLHVGVVHLLMNMFALLYIGLFLEPILGRLRFAMAYLVTGVIASSASLYWHDLTVSAGASGAIFGMYGVFLALLTTNFVEKTTRKTLLTSIILFVAYNLLYGMKGSIDNAAHIGGLGSGLVVGYLFYPGLKNPTNEKLAYYSIGPVLLFGLVTSFVICLQISDDIVAYQKKMQTFADQEERALSVYKLSEAGAPKEQLLSAIKDTGIYYWNKDLELLQEVGKLKIPAALKVRTDTLIDYCNVRLASYNYMYRKLEGNTGSDTDSLKYYNSRIRKIIHTLRNK